MTERNLDERKRQLWQALRLLRLLSDSREGLTKGELAEVLSVHPRTIMRLIGALGEIFWVDERLDDGRKRYFIEQSIGAEFSRLTVAEMAALDLEVRSRAIDGAPHGPALRSLQDKILLALKPGMRARLNSDRDVLERLQKTFVTPGPAARVDPQVIGTLQEALLRSCCLDIAYQSQSETTPRLRRVEPWGLATGPLAYLVAKPVGEARTLRNYRVDRIAQAALSSQPAVVPEDWDLDRWMTDSIGVFHGDAHDIVLRVRPSAVERALRWRFHSRQLIERDGDELVVRFRAGGLRELAEHLFTWGDGIRIEAPAALQATMRERIAMAASAL